MRCDHLVVWDDFVSTNLFEYHSPCELDERLGRFDQIALICILTDVAAASGTNTANLQVYLTHSGDGEHFISKNSSGSPPVTAEIDLSWTTKPGSALVGWGSDPTPTIVPPTPMLRHVRINLYMTNGGGPVWARVYATLRDQAPGAANALQLPSGW